MLKVFLGFLKFLSIIFAVLLIFSAGVVVGSIGAMPQATGRIPVIVTVGPRNNGQLGEGGVHVVQCPGDQHVIVDAHIGTYHKHGIADTLEDR